MKEFLFGAAYDGVSPFSPPLGGILMWVFGVIFVGSSSFLPLDDDKDSLTTIQG